MRYWVKAELHRPWLLPMKTKKEFTVFEHIDINTPLLLVSSFQTPLGVGFAFQLAEALYKENTTFVRLALDVIFLIMGEHRKEFFILNL